MEKSAQASPAQRGRVKITANLSGWLKGHPERKRLVSLVRQLPDQRFWSTMIEAGVIKR
jgi:hypothetical protein